MIKSREYSMSPDSPPTVFDAEWYGGKIMKVEREGQFFFQCNYLFYNIFKPCRWCRSGSHNRRNPGKDKSNI